MYLLGTKDAYIQLRAQSGDPVLVQLVGYSDSDWAGDSSSRKSQSCGHVGADGRSLTSFSRRQSCAATSSGRVPCDVVDCGGAVAFESSTGTLQVQSEHDSFL